MALIIVSNRVMTADPDERTAGGVAGALRAALERFGGTWIGWSGETAEAGEEKMRSFSEDGITYALIDLSQQHYDEYYAGFANRALWPVMHYRLGLTAFSQEDFEGYLRVNTAFAGVVATQTGPGDAIWVHDYHLMPLAAELRAMGDRRRIGYFHHIPWPPPEVFAILPNARQLLRAMMDYDVVGLQTATDAEHFGQCLRRELGAQDAAAEPGETRSRSRRVLHLGGRHVTVLALPIGVDAKGIAAMANAAKTDPTVVETIASLGGRDMIIGVDRLDYSKGVAQRMEAYGEFLERRPALRGQLEYVQITPFSRSDIPEYEAINREVAETAGRINGALGEASWTPIRYVNRTYSREVISGLYRAARVALVTPMRDGMNLVAKEFVAAQDGRNPGALVLSRFAGSVRQLKGALVVNPYDRHAVVEAIEAAFAMPLAERQERWRFMRAGLRRQDIAWWIERNVAELHGQRTPDA